MPYAFELKQRNTQMGLSHFITTENPLRGMSIFIKLLIYAALTSLKGFTLLSNWTSK